MLNRLSWKWLFFVLAAILAVAVFGGAMAVAGGGVVCTFNAPIWEACLKTAFSMLVLRIGVPLLVVIALIKLISEKKK